MPAAKPSKKADKSPSKRAAAAKAEPDAKRKRTQPKGEAAGGAQAPPPKAEAKAGDEIDDLFGKLKGSTSSIKKASFPTRALYSRALDPTRLPAIQPVSRGAPL